MKARLIRSGLKHPKSALNIEIAHVATDVEDYSNSLARAISKSFETLDGISLSRHKLPTARSILVDDKRRSVGSKKKWLESTLASVPGIEKVDYVTFESELKDYLNILYAKLVPSQRNEVSKQIERYLSSKGHTACSHDIALWHSLRLGFLGARGLPVFQLDHEGSERLVSSFIAGNVVSVLPSTDRNAEEDAVVDILQHIDPAVGNYRRIDRYYY